MEEVFDQYFSNFNVPVIYDFPSGHGSKNISIPLGVIAEIDTEDSISTEDLICHLIASNLSSIQNDKHDLENRLIQKFEVTKKVFNSYEKGMGKGRGDFKDPYLYIIFSIFFPHGSKTLP